MSCDSINDGDGHSNAIKPNEITYPAFFLKNFCGKKNPITINHNRAIKCFMDTTNMELVKEAISIHER